MIDEPSPTQTTTPRRPPADRAAIHRRGSSLKNAVIAATLAGFLALWGLVGNHVVGVTSHGPNASNSVPAAAPAPGSGGLFDNGNNAGNVGAGDGSSPALSSGAS
jgi:hypothetical protein